MAETLQFVDGFDDYGTLANFTPGGWVLTTNGVFSVVAGNVAGSAIKCDPGGGNWASRLERNHNPDAYIHELFAWRPGSALGPVVLWRAMESATEHLRLAYNGNGTFTFSRAGTTVGVTPTSSNQGIVTDTWYHIEIMARVHDTLGQYDVWINGVLVCTDGGTHNYDTRNGGTAGTPDQTSLGHNANNSPTQSFDDFACYIGSGGSQKGIARVVTALPTGDGATVAWAASAGSDYQCVDEATPNGDTDFISSATPNDIDTFTYPALGLTGTVLGVAPTSVARKDDAGTRSIREVVRASGTDYPGGADLTLTSTYVAYQQVWETNPAGGAWTVAAVDGASFGVKLTA